MTFKKCLHSRSEVEYGANYKSHYLDIYKIYVELTDKISARRQTANSYFLSINTAILGAISVLNTVHHTKFSILINIIGVVLCVIWSKLIESYKKVGIGRYKVIREIEKSLPISPYEAEWAIIKPENNSEAYIPFSNLEQKVPWIFLGIHIVIPLFILSIETIIDK